MDTLARKQSASADTGASDAESSSKAKGQSKPLEMVWKLIQ
jgi:hypothetical protein